MGLKVTITIDEARKIDQGVWKARLKQAEVETLGKCSSKAGLFSVLHVETDVVYNEQNQTITFDPSATNLLNIGNTDQVLVLSDTNGAAPIQMNAVGLPPLIDPPETLRESPSSAAPAESKKTDLGPPQALATGDKLFLSELPPDMRDLGESLITEIRRYFPGELCFEPRAAKFDETPEIFWTVKILVNEKSLRITVRGTPQMFQNTAGIQLKADKFGYSAFLISRPSQIPGAMEVVKQAHAHMTR